MALKRAGMNPVRIEALNVKSVVSGCNVLFLFFCFTTL
jgi:hypothetical protein